MNIFERVFLLWGSWVQSASWQIAFLVVLVGILTVFAKKLSPRWRYALWLLVILKVFLPPSLTLFWGVGNWGIPPLRNHSQRILQKYIPRQITIIPPAQKPAIGEASPITRETRMIERENPSLNKPKSASPSPIHKPERSLLNVLFLVWLGGTALFISLILFRYIYFTRILRKSLVIEEGPLRVDLERLALTLGKNGAPDLLVSDRVTSPFLFGIFHPRIILPVGLEESLNPEEMKHVLLHELIHWKRRDVIVGWVQVAAQALFWFHPFVWLANERLRHERECACDEAAVSLGKSPPKSYGESLLKVLLAARGRSSVSLGFLGIFERNTRLQNRLEEIMNYKTGSRSFGVMSWILVILFAAIFVPMGTMRGPAAAGNTGSKQNNLMSAEPPAPPVCLSYVDDTAEGKKSLGGSGHAVRFSRSPENKFVESIQIFASRYGYPEPPREDFHVYILNEKKEVLADLKYPYSMVERGELKWYTLKTPSTLVPEEFHIALSFNPHQTKGIYIGKDDSVSESHSFTGLPESGFEEIGEKYDWMIRVYLTQTPSQDSNARGKVPRIVETFPAVGAKDVDPSITSISVTFDQDMDTRGYSWTTGGSNFPPQPEGSSVHWRDKRICVLPVRLDPGRFYRAGINSTSHENFRSALDVPASPAVIYFTTAGSGEEGKEKLRKPEVVDMYPENGSVNVNPNIKEIIVTFNVPMNSGYSWTGAGPNFPTVMESLGTHWTNDHKTCVLPVDMKPNWTYYLGLNSPSHNNFQSAEGVPLEPVKYQFTTGE